MFGALLKVRLFKSPFWRDWLFWFVATGVTFQIIVAVKEYGEWVRDDQLIFFAYFLVWAVVAFVRAADDATHM